MSETTIVVYTGNNFSWIENCITCGSNKIEYNDFTDSVSRKEFRISRMCQECQDKLWDEEQYEEG